MRDSRSRVRDSRLLCDPESFPMTAAGPADSLGTKHVPTNRRHKYFFSQCFNTPHQDLELLKRRRGKQNWRVPILKALHSHKAQVALASLLMIDILVVFAELFIEGEFPECEIIRRHAISCCNVTQGETATPHSRLLAQASNSDQCQVGLVPDDYAVACSYGNYQALHTAHDALYAVTMSILAVFLVELSFLLVLLDKQFFQNLLNVADFIVVVASMSLESIFRNSSIGSAAGGIVTLRLLRFLRVIHGLGTLVDDMNTDAEHQDGEELSVDQLLEQKAKIERMIRARKDSFVAEKDCA